MTVKAQSGVILAGEILSAKPSLDNIWLRGTSKLLSTLVRMGSLPASIVVRNERQEALFHRVTRDLGIKLTRRASLPALDQAKKEMEQVLLR